MTITPKPEMRMDAYYYGFYPTGNEAIDKVLSAIATAGKAYHNTADWNDECDYVPEYLVGKTPIEWIQNAAKDAAAENERLKKEVERLEQIAVVRDVALANATKDDTVTVTSTTAEPQFESLDYLEIRMISCKLCLMSTVIPIGQSVTDAIPHVKHAKWCAAIADRSEG